jgi:hypothetical protein
LAKILLPFQLERLQVPSGYDDAFEVPSRARTSRVEPERVSKREGSMRRAAKRKGRVELRESSVKRGSKIQKRGKKCGGLAKREVYGEAQERRSVLTSER